MDSLIDIVARLNEMNHRLKYYNDNQFTLETMEALAKELSEVEDTLHYQKTERARELFISEILQNKTLRKRQDMIDATEAMEL